MSRSISGKLVIVSQIARDHPLGAKRINVELVYWFTEIGGCDYPLNCPIKCLDHVIVLNEASLRRILRSYCRYYELARTHLALGKDPPESREVQPRECGVVVELPEVGGLHHRYERRAA